MSGFFLKFGVFTFFSLSKYAKNGRKIHFSLEKMEYELTMN